MPSSKIASKVLDFIFPQKCVVCGKNGRYFCQDCRRLLKAVPFQRCPICGLSSWRGMTHPRCFSRFSLNGVVSLYVYNRPLAVLIKEFKLGLVKEMAPVLSQLVVRKLQEAAIVSFWQRNSFLFSVVPLHQRKKEWRGFSQVEILAERINRLLQLEFRPRILVRTKLTVPQAKLSSQERRQNIKGAFAVDAQYRRLIKRRDILVFDDVLTSGATLKETARELKKAGARRVWGLTIAT
jgi:ComF family protein